jgi:hypothetical protein
MTGKATDALIDARDASVIELAYAAPAPASAAMVTQKYVVLRSTVEAQMEVFMNVSPVGWMF